jgi:hypothetical protein
MPARTLHARGGSSDVGVLPEDMPSNMVALSSSSSRGLSKTDREECGTYDISVCAVWISSYVCTAVFLPRREKIGKVNVLNSC